MSKFMKKTKSLKTTRKPKSVKTTSTLASNFPISNKKETNKPLKRENVQPKQPIPHEARYSMRQKNNGDRFIRNHGRNIPPLNDR